ncbi:MAG TPA: LysM peptidoglycan-binding domain-containing protein [Polyangiaceae bacterium]|nr:LysM peptidoglycan-binding domain-containing protein [Polyangiaceae bacterium]
MTARRAPRLAAACLAAALALASGPDARAFPHVVRARETLAQIAERVYGRVEMEQLLVAANGLYVGAGISIVPGMRLEVPAVSHYRVTSGDTWPLLAERLLGDAERSDVLALANDAMPWLPPADGMEILVPYNLRYVAEQGDSTLTLAYRFLGERDKAWMLDRYNRRKGDPIRRGDVLLVPLTSLPLTPEGKAEAANAVAMVRSEGLGRTREAQRKADAELPQLAADIQRGRFVDAVARGSKLLGYGDLARPQLASIHRHLTEAYVALDATGLAETSCAAWRDADPAAKIDPVELSPKIVRVCTAAAVAPQTLPPSPPSRPAEESDAGPPRSVPGSPQRDRNPSGR